ncbi:MAG TPA: hypothetical protein PLV25_07800 [Opitutales bacterium]|nr:hypothetical protein [Opitutales bacterium]
MQTAIMGIRTVIIRHPRERLSKCSLQPLNTHPDLTFIKATPHLRFDATGYILLGLDAPVLSDADRGHPLLLLDSTWRLLPDLESKLVGIPIRRTLPEGLQTAYPRVSKIAADPLGGLASVEALYLAWKLLGVLDPTVLAHYYWRERFLMQFKA